MKQHKKRPRQLPKATHAFYGRKLKAIDDLLSEITLLVGNTYGATAPGVKYIGEARWHLVALRAFLDGCAYREYREPPRRGRGYFPGELPDELRG